MTQIPSDVPPAVLQAALDLARVVNDNGPRCIGIVCVVVYPEGACVLPLIDREVRLPNGDSPIRALLEDAADAIDDRLDGPEGDLAVPADPSDVN